MDSMGFSYPYVAALKPAPGPQVFFLSPRGVQRVSFSDDLFPPFLLRMHFIPHLLSWRHMSIYDRYSIVHHTTMAPASRTINKGTMNNFQCISYDAIKTLQNRMAT